MELDLLNVLFALVAAWSAGIALEMGLISQEIVSMHAFIALFTAAMLPRLLKRGADWLRGRGAPPRTAPVRRGTLIVGAGALARALARALSRSQPVWLIDRNAERCALARDEGLQATCGNALQEQVLSEGHAAEAQAVIAMTAHADVDTRVARLARSVFSVPECYVLQPGDDEDACCSALQHLDASVLFAKPVALEVWEQWAQKAPLHVIQEPVSSFPDPAPMAIDEAVRQAGRHPLAVATEGRYEPFHQRQNLRERDIILVLSRDIRVGDRPAFYP